MTKFADEKCKRIFTKIPLDLLIEKFNYAKLTPLNQINGKKRESIYFEYKTKAREKFKLTISIWEDNLVELDVIHEYITYESESYRYVYERMYDYESTIHTLNSYDNFIFKRIPKKIINKKLTPNILLLLNEQLEN